MLFDLVVNFWLTSGQLRQWLDKCRKSQRRLLLLPGLTSTLYNPLTTYS